MQTMKKHLELLLNSLQGKESSFLPTDNFCIRKTTSVFINNRYWIYADVIPWNHKYWPDTYDTSIHAFSSPDCNQWTYHGEVVRHRENTAWDFGGVATPGALYNNEKIFIFYSGREKTNGKGWRQIGVAIADNPAGPFKKNDLPAVKSTVPESHLDDPIPIISEDGRGIDLYYRQADHHLQPPNYSIRRIQSKDGGITWSEPIIIRAADKIIRAYETLDAIRINGNTILVTFDHFSNGELKTAFYSSPDGKYFRKEAICYLEDFLPKEWTKPVCAFNVMLMSGAQSKLTHIGITRAVDNKSHYNMEIYPI